jgi:2'-5' RNA ligase
MRLFVAVVPPDPVLDDLDEHLEPRREAGPEIRWTDRHQWHVTLAFLGAVPEARLDDLTEALARSAARRDPLVLRLAGAGAFPNPYAARVLWAGVDQVRGDLGTVAGGIRNAAGSAGATPDGTRFHPHLTLGRFHRPSEATRWIRALEAWEGPAWRVEQLALVESHLGEGRGRRPRYEVVADLPLRGVAARPD